MHGAGWVDCGAGTIARPGKGHRVRHTSQIDSGAAYIADRLGGGDGRRRTGLNQDQPKRTKQSRAPAGDTKDRGEPSPKKRQTSPHGTGATTSEVESRRHRQDTDSWRGSITCGRLYAECSTFLTWSVNFPRSLGFFAANRAFHPKAGYSIG